MLNVKLIALIFALLILSADSDRHRRHKKKKRPKRTTILQTTVTTTEAVYPWTLACQRNKLNICNCFYSGKMDCTFVSGNGSSPLKSAYIKLEDSVYSPREVYLNDNSIELFEADKFLVGQEESIERLEISNNHLSWIEFGAFDRLRNLKSLYLSNNYLKLDQESRGWITEKLGNRLETLYLDGNLLEKLYDGVFDKLRNLEMLNLDYNPSLILSKHTFGQNLSKLYSLSLEGCRMRNFPAEVFKNLIGLKHLYLNNNPLSSIPAALKLAYNLEVLDLSQTEIKELRPDSFTMTPKLTDLKMINMPELEIIEQCAFCELSQLITIELTNSSRLRSISDNAFGLATQYMNATYKLKVFYANNCQFESFSPKLLNWEEMHIASISGNPLNCDEEMEWLMKDKSINLAYRSAWAPRCFTPIERRGSFVRGFDAIRFAHDEEERYKREEEKAEQSRLHKIFALIFVVTMAVVFITCICCVHYS